MNAKTKLEGGARAMAALCLTSLGRQLVWWAEAFSARGRAAAPLGLRRLLFLLVLYPPLVALQCLHWLAWGLDALFFPGSRAVEVRRPLFITGLPRSGTTFVHRQLAREAATFTTLRTWEAVLAPTIIERRIVRAVAALDRRCLRGWGRAQLGAWTHRLVGREMAAVHRIGLEAAEEDYLALLPAAGCFGLALAFPASPSLWQLGDPAAMDQRHRARLLAFYHRLVQKHLFVHGSRSRRFLSKNAAFGAWTPYLRDTFPGARFILCIRSPASGLRSQMRSIRSPRQWLGTDAAAFPLKPFFLAQFAAVYRCLAAFLEADEARAAAVVILQSDLRHAAPELLARALGELGYSTSPTLRAATPRSAPPPAAPAESAAPDAPCEPLPSELRAAFERVRAHALKPRLPAS